MFTAGLFTIAKIGSNLNAHQQRMDKEDVEDIHNGILLSPKKEQNNAICSDMGGPRDDPTK